MLAFPDTRDGQNLDSPGHCSTFSQHQNPQVPDRPMRFERVTVSDIANNAVADSATDASSGNCGNCSGVVDTVNHR